MRFRKKLMFLVLMCLFVVTITGCGGLGSSDQEYPSREITLIVPYAPGGSADPTGRTYARQLEEILGVSVVVQNREGGSGSIGTSELVEAEPDGYTLGLGFSESLALQPLVNEDLPYNGTDDYQPIFKLADQSFNLTVREDAPWQSLEEFMDYAKANPGELQVSIGAATRDLQVAELNQAADVDIETVPFNGGSDSIGALQGDRVDAVVTSAPGIAGQVEAGDFRVLGTFTEEQYEFFPEAPTFTKAGYDVRSLGDLICIIGPEGLPDDVLNTLVEASREVATSKEFSQFAEENGLIVDPEGPEKLAAELENSKEIYAELR